MSVDGVEQRVPRRPTVCLSMIVRDEAHIVTETLAAVAPHIDHWVVVDTGSVDGTPAIVAAFFADLGIPGTLHERPWRDFGTNRTEALQLAAGHADYTWVIDADDLVAGELDLSSLEADAYSLRYGTEFVFWRTQIFRSTLPWRYEGVLHEYPVCDAPARIERLEGDYHLVWRTMGGRSQVADKFARDVAVLAEAHERDPDDPRTVFYLAQSHRDAGDDLQALERYEQRAAMGGWGEEVYVARLEAARCRHRLGRDWPEVQAAYLAAWEARPSRVEALYELARHHRLAGDHAAAHLFASRGIEIPPSEDQLFVAADLQAWRLLDEGAISAYYLGRFDESARWCRRLLDEGELPEAERSRVEANLHFALDASKDRHLGPHPDRVAEIEARRAAGAGDGVTLTITSGRRLDLFTRTVDSFLACCEDLASIERWICIDEGSSDEDRAEMAARYPFFEFVWKGPADAGHPASMNLLRARVSTPWWLHLEDDWQFVERRPLIAEARALLEHDATVGQVLFNRCYAETFADRDLAGGRIEIGPSGQRWWHQEVLVGGDLERHLAGLGPAGRSNAWWPHYSLRPSLVRTEAVVGVGPYDPGADHFELEFAQRYAAAGLRTAALDAISCLHLGPLTSERGAARRPNAYELAGTRQFGAPSGDGPARIRPLAWWATPTELVARWDRQTTGGGRWGSIELSDAPDPDYWAVFTHPGPTTRPDDQLDPARTIVLQTEPTAGIEQWEHADGWDAPSPAAFLQVRRPGRFGSAAEWHLSSTAEELLVMTPTKTRDLSAIVSSKRQLPGQQLRLALVHHLEEQGFPVDIYGADNAEGFATYLGPLPAAAKDAGIFPYRYTIAVENSAEPGYFTEKIVDAVLGECVAFYWGCPDLEDRLDPRCFIRLPLEDPDASLAVIAEAIAADEWSARIDAIRAEKRRILDELQLMAVLDRTVRGHRRLLDVDLRVINLDRRPDRLRTFDQQLRRTAGDVLADRVRRVPAIDGQELVLTDEIAETFRGNDHGYRRAIVACALSHLEVWRQIVASGRPSIVFEDDVVVVEGFTGLLVELLAQHGDQDPAADLVLLGLVPYDEARDRATLPVGRPVQLVSFDPENYLGGSFGYLLTPEGAATLLRLVERDGIAQAIDWFVGSHADELRIARCRPDLVLAELAWPGRSGDSDIQHDLVTLARASDGGDATGRPVE